MNRISRASDRYRDYVTCPYNPAHTLPPGRVQYHLIKCRKQHPHVQLETCPYNATHLFKKEDEDDHLEDCDDRQAMEVRRYGLMAPLPGQHGNLDGPPVFGSDLLMQDREERDEINFRRRDRSTSPAIIARDINAIVARDINTSFDGSVIAAVRKNVEGAGILSEAYDENASVFSVVSSYSRRSSIVRATPTPTECSSVYMTPCKQHWHDGDDEDKEKSSKQLEGVTDRLTQLALSRLSMESQVTQAPISLPTSKTGRALQRLSVIQKLKEARRLANTTMTTNDMWDEE